MSLELPRVGLGTAPFGGMYELIPEEQAIATVEQAWKRGIRLFDTAPLYGAGVSEHRLGLALRHLPRDEYVLATKVGRLVTGEQPLPFDFSRDGVLRSVEASLQRLQVDRIDILHLHDPDNHFREAVDEAYPVLDELRRQGVIRGIGAGMNQWEMLADLVREVDLDCVLLAGRYTLLEQVAAFEGLFPVCRQRGTQVIAAGIYNTGILATGAQPGAMYQYQPASPEIMQQVAELEQVCERWDVPLRTAAVQFPLRADAVSSIVVGARMPEEIDALIESVHSEVPEGFWQEIAPGTA